MKALFLITLFFSAGVAAQETSSKFYWGVISSADAAYRVLSISDEPTNAPVDFIIESRNNSEKPVLGYQIGGVLGYKWRSRITFESGIVFSRSGYKANFDKFIFPQNSQNDPDLPTSSNAADNFYYLSIPVLAHMSFGQKKLKFVTSLGGGLNYLLAAQGVSKLSGPKGDTRSTYNRTEEFNRFNFTPQISAGISYDMTEKMQLKILPTFRYGIVRIIDAPITGHLWSAGLNVGLNIGL
jgi:hypothetical protein